jgi:uncharacterized DUF497 family protein
VHFRTFDWDEWNVAHVARHGLEPSDVEEACRGNVVVVRGRRGSYLAYGRTGAGRYVLVVLRSYGRGVARVLTARDMTPTERQLYHRRRT